MSRIALICGMVMENSRLYIANFNYSVTNQELKELFSSYGEVKNVKIIEGKGSGLIEMASQSDAERAKKALDGSVFKGRPLKILI